ncbi:MAG: hypothetical protein LIP23_10280 [Planctomycetes bacterium]|nr:hypothetical protein [Planctomycetota bacterium]
MADKQPQADASSSLRKNASVRSRALGRIPATLEALNSAKTSTRREAVAEAVQSFDNKEITRPQEMGWANVLARTFFSYSADNYSPSRLTWEAVIRGLSVIGSLDIDNLGALGEMFSAGDALAIRTTVSLETRVYVESYKDQVINCPGEPGVMNAIGAGFALVPDPTTQHGSLIASLPDRAHTRNRAIVAAINDTLTPVTVDYDADVLPLTPAGNATPLHIIAAYVLKSKTVFEELYDRAVFWADVLGRSPQDAECLLGEPGELETALADKLDLAERVDPTHAGSSLYPGVVEFFRAVKASGAVPCLPLLDSLPSGEALDKLLDNALQWGVRAVAILPDFYWNITDLTVKTDRMALLERLVTAARQRNLPILVGSKMDRPKQKFMDALDAPELSAYFRDFTDSAFWLYGHTVMERADRNGITSDWAKRHFGRDYAAANAFYLEVGKKAKPEACSRANIADAGADADPGDVLNSL